MSQSIVFIKCRKIIMSLNMLMYLYISFETSRVFPSVAWMNRRAFLRRIAENVAVPKQPSIFIACLDAKVCFLLIAMYVRVHSHKTRCLRAKKKKRERKKGERAARKGWALAREKTITQVTEQERRTVAMVTIKGADQTRRDEGSPFIVDFVTQKPPPRNRRIRSLRATPPIHPLTLVLSSSAGAESICGIETSELAKKGKRRRDAYVAPTTLHRVPGTTEVPSNRGD